MAPTLSRPVRVTVLAPVAAPYREGLFRALAARSELDLHVLYADARQPSWDVPEDYFRVDHAYPATHLRSLQLPRPGRTPVMVPAGIGAALTATAPEVIVASEYGPSAIRARVWAARHQVPHLLFTECPPAIDRLLPASQLAWHRAFARRVDGAIAVSTAAARRLEALGVDPARITVALQAAELDAIRAAASRRAAAGDDPAGRTLRVLCVARLVPDKGIALLLRAAAQAAADLAPRRLALDIVGDGFLRPRLEATAAELGLEASFPGHEDAAALAARYARADLFALLSSYEPFGVVLREAASAGLAILTTTGVGAAGDVARDGENARLVRPGDLSAAAVALTELLADPARRAAMGRASAAIDAETRGRDETAWVSAILTAAGRQASSAGSTSCSRRASVVDSV